MNVLRSRINRKLLIALFPLTIAFLFFPVASDCQVNDEIVPWENTPAQSISRGTLQAGMFHSWKYGISGNTEISTHPLWLWVNPYLSVKHTWEDEFSLKIATIHTIIYPTPLLRLIQKKGVGGIIAEDPTIGKIPQMVAIKNEVLVSLPFHGPHYFSARAGVNFSLKSKTPDKRTTIDLPVVYPRLAVYYNDISLTTGIGIQGPLLKRIGYLTKADVFWLPGTRENFFLEHNGMFLWKTGERWWIDVGYKLTFGKYPFGTQWHLLPILDVRWIW